ncbi:Cytidylate kinase [Candidatus Lokiarchaeum ossiferum]|uniref:Cytidylate kinase n=1 Tax=Candidatus Lokiarchaeum ossiferum TaxID=2951803 RepID=A0ABY6HU22_9ARCH|nr:Cytidylate kinase [Candidatus Lokiarchaeum sp. B-35]
MKQRINRIHIVGASGSGTTTLAQAIAKRLDWHHFDTDNYYWIPTTPPFRIKRKLQARQEMLKKDLSKHESWTLSGSLCGWGDMLISYFDLVIYLWIPPKIRMVRLAEREKQRYGDRIESGGTMYEKSQEFLNWARGYDEGDMNTRSKMLHDGWLKKLSCKILKLEGNFELEEKVDRVLALIS